MIVVMMGPCGCGKTTVGRALAQALGLPFIEGDDFHPAENASRLRAGIPLRDADRWPWLALLTQEMEAREEAGGGVMACSALKEAYRVMLRNTRADVRFVYLKGGKEALARRLDARARQGGGEHLITNYPAILAAQLKDLEEPDTDDALTLPIGLAVDEAVARIIKALGPLDSTAP